MRQAGILFRDEEAGVLTQHDDGTFTFQYHTHWVLNTEKPAISLTLPKTEAVFRAPVLFPCFANMLPEGTNKQAICTHNRIDADDYYSLLIVTARFDSIGAIRVAPSAHAAA